MVEYKREKDYSDINHDMRRNIDADRRRRADKRIYRDKRKRRDALGCARRHRGARTVLTRRSARLFVPQGHTLQDSRFHLFVCVDRIRDSRYGLAHRIVNKYRYF